jgi:hypothetical protein
MGNCSHADGQLERYTTTFSRPFIPYWERAEQYLQSKGFTVIGHGEITDGFIIISETFEPLKKIKP